MTDSVHFSNVSYSSEGYAVYGVKSNVLLMAGSIAKMTRYTWNETASKYDYEFLKSEGGWRLVEPASLLNDMPKGVPGYPPPALIASLFLGIVYILYKKIQWNANE